MMVIEYRIDTATSVPISADKKETLFQSVRGFRREDGVAQKKLFFAFLQFSLTKVVVVCCSFYKKSFIFKLLNLGSSFKKNSLRHMQSERWFAFVKCLPYFFAKLQIWWAGFHNNICVH
ncbi:MAG: hypothetical protein R6V33_08570 [Pelovirga sp.]